MLNPQTVAAARYESLWRGNCVPNLDEFVASVLPITSSELLAILQVDVREHWRRGVRVFSESYLERFPQLRSDDVATVGLIVAEFSVRNRAGDSPKASDYFDRFPQLKSALMAKLAEYGTSDKAVPVSDGGTVSRDGNHDTTHDFRLNEFRAPTLSGSFGRYQIKTLLGRGGMGSVYLARDTVLDRDVALKIPRFSLDADSIAIERFYREAKSAARLSHPTLCTVYDVGQHNGVPYLALQYVPGETLAEVLRKRGPLPPHLAVSIVCRVADGLEVVHQSGILHRDLKPANVMFNERDEPIVMDFGLATIQVGTQSRITSTGDFLGTPAYASPEQLLGETAELSPRSDVYSLGVMLFELLTGRTPFIGPLASIVKQALVDSIPAPSKFRSDLPESLDDVCRKATARDPTDRYSSMRELAADLRAIMEALEDLPIGQLSMKPIPEPRVETTLLPSDQVLPWTVRVRHKFKKPLMKMIVLASALSAAAWITWKNLPTPPDKDLSSDTAELDSVPMNIEVTDAGWEFNGKSSYVDIGGLTYDFSHPLTIEAWVTPYESDWKATLVTNSRVPQKGMSLYLHQNGHWVFHAGSDAPDAGNAISDSPTKANVRIHIAGTCQQNGTRLFVNGASQASGGWMDNKPTPSSDPIVLGCEPLANQSHTGFFSGVIHCLRISRGVVYSEDFVPPPTLTLERNTLALFDAAQNKKFDFIDLSNNGHHGKMVNVVWRRRGTGSGQDGEK